MPYFYVCLTLFTIGILSVTDALLIGSECPNGWIQNESKCYLFSTAKLYFSGSEKYCKSQGAKLAEPVDRSEIKFLGSRVKAISENFFIGIVDTHVEGEWVFLSNDGYIEETDWAPNEPTVSRAQIEDCGEIGVHGMWADVICNSSRRFICEKNAVQDAGVVIG